MPAYNVIIQPEAELDLDGAFEYLESQKSTLGFDLLAEVVAILEILKTILTYIKKSAVKCDGLLLEGLGIISFMLSGKRRFS